MIANRELSVDDYLAIARRRAVLVLVPAILGPIIGFLVSFGMTPRYTSRSLLLVVDQVVPTDYFKPIVTERVSDRMTILQQNVLSPSRLQPLVHRLGLARNGKTEEVAVNEIRGNVVVARASLGKPASSFGGTPGGTADVPGFYVMYTADNPRDAQLVCAEVTSMLLTENSEVRGEMARSTTEFLSRQLEQAKRNLDELDKKLAEFRHEHLGRLPGDADAELRILTSLESQLDASNQSLNRLQEDKARAETLLEQELSVWKSAQAAPTFPTLRQQLIKLQEQLVVLESQYTDNHPNVVKAKHEIARLQARLSEMDSEADQSDALRNATVPRSGFRFEPPDVMRLREQIRRDDAASERITEGQKRLLGLIELYQGRLSQTPQIEEEYKQLTRDSATAHNIYDTLLTNKNTAEMQTEMEVSQQGEQLRLLDPAHVPGSPSFPVRTTFAEYGFAIGLCFGFGIAVWLEFRDKSIRDEADVVAALQLPMLASVPCVGAMEESMGWAGRFGGRFSRFLTKE
jgi:uncharacterized protein involved in exopolysaccharide biosynthesis